MSVVVSAVKRCRVCGKVFSESKSVPSVARNAGWQLMAIVAQVQGQVIRHLEKEHGVPAQSNCC